MRSRLLFERQRLFATSFVLRVLLSRIDFDDVLEELGSDLGH